MAGEFGPTVDSEHYTSFDPFVLAVWGPPRSGKSEFANYLARFTNIMPIDIDEIRFHMFGRRFNVLPAEIEQQELSEAYAEFYRFASDRLTIDSSPVALINTGSTNLHRVNAINFAAEHSVPFVSAVIQTPVHILEERAEQQKAQHDFSNISSRAEVQRNIARTEAFPEDTLIINGQAPLALQIKSALKHLTGMKDEPKPKVNFVVPRRYPSAA